MDIQEIDPELETEALTVIVYCALLQAALTRLPDSICDVRYDMICNVLHISNAVHGL